MAPVVVDSTPLIAPERIEQLEILTRLFPEIVAPPTVAEEFGRTPPWLSVRAISNHLSAAVLQTQLHRGEAEAIALAAEIPADRIILDDKKARRIARDLGLRTVGTVGVILLAKRAGLVAACRPLLDSLIRAGFHVSAALHQEALRLAGEDRS